MTYSSRELSLLSNTDVLGYIQAQNVARNAQAKAEGWEFWSLIAEEIASDYANVDEMEVCFARGAYSDTHKDWCGRRGYVSNELTLEQVEAEVDRMAKWAADEYQAELEWQAEQEKLEREEIALGMIEPTEEVVLEEWEIYEAKAEAAGY